MEKKPDAVVVDEKIALFLYKKVYRNTQRYRALQACVDLQIGKWIIWTMKRGWSQSVEKCFPAVLGVAAFLESQPALAAGGGDLPVSWLVPGGLAVAGLAFWAGRHFTPQAGIEDAKSLVAAKDDALEKSRQELAEKSQMLQATLDSIDQGFAVWDSGYNLVAFNAKCLDFWYHPVDVTIGMPMMDLLFHLASTGAFGTAFTAEELASRNFDRVIAAGPYSQEEFSLVDGRIIHIRRYPMQDGGHASVYTDVTEERLSAAALEDMTIEAEASNRAKTEFLSAMSHELRTPLNAILGFTQILGLADDPPIAPEHKEMLTHISASGQQLLALINEVLDLAKIESGRVRLEHKEVSVAAVLNECEPMLEPLLAKSDVSVHYPDLSGVEDTVFADPNRLRQVLLNFLTNAVKYNRPGGDVTVTVHPVDLANMKISVADTGFGISEEEQENLFQPFNRLGAENSDVEGTGIGLTICRRLTEAMDGKIGVDSVPGEGSVFWVSFPTRNSA